MSTFLISDTHFRHKNIMEYENRPFSSVEEMKDVIISNWNSVVKDGDKVFFLGDFGFVRRKEAEEILSILHGNKILIKGNHDRMHSVNWWMEVGFKEVSNFPIIYKKFYMFSHEPLYVNSNMPYINVHGHIHSKNYEGSQYVNVSVEQINYTPINFENIKKLTIDIVERKKDGE